MAGLLDWIGTPEGQGLLSAAFGGLASARRGAPLNAIGAAGLAGLQGFDQQRQYQDQDTQRQLAKLQLQQTKNQLDANQRYMDAMRTGASTPVAAPVADTSPYSPSVTQAFGLPSGTSQAQLQSANPVPAAPEVDPAIATARRAINAAMLSGDMQTYQNALKSYAELKATMPKFATDVRVVKGSDGKPMAVQMADDGTVRPMTGYAPADKLVFQNTGAVTQGLDPYTGQPLTTIKNTMSPDASASNDIAKRRLGLEFGLTPEGSQMDGVTAKAIAEGRLPPPSGMALTNPRNQRILSQVMAINPNYDFTDVTAKKTAAANFTSGNQGNAMRSFAVAGQHLDQLGQLVDAMDNKNTQLVNKVANIYSQQTGSPAVTNFEAAKDVVSKEVIKAIVGGGGGVSEREELAKTMSNVNSPAQLKGVIAQYRNLMSAQHDALLQQRRAAGLSDSTLPDYSGTGSSATSGAVDFSQLRK